MGLRCTGDECASAAQHDADERLALVHGSSAFTRPDRPHAYNALPHGRRDRPMSTAGKAL
jgi:hypothetical protein